MLVPLSVARRLALLTQGLDGREAEGQGKDAAVQTIERLGYVQIDTIAVVERAHHHVLWSRVPTYQPSMLDSLLAEDRLVFEYWTHAAAYVPMHDYRFYLPHMRAYARSTRTQQWLEEHQDLVAHVRARLREEGPLGTSDFKAPEGFQDRGWWSWKPAKRALETLFTMGEVMVTERRNFQRIYDLTERVLPSEVDTREPDEFEFHAFNIRRVLGNLGFVPEKLLAWARVKPKHQVLEALVDAGEVTRFEIEGREGEPCYALTAPLQLVLSEEAAGPSEVHILSPFDNLVIQRRWLKAYFDFDYSLEAYLPAEKRRYGYFCLPILWGETFVGRIDAKADRSRGVLIARQAFLESEDFDHDTLLPGLATRLWDFAAFNGCQQITVEEIDPPDFKNPLLQSLQRARPDPAV